MQPAIKCLQPLDCARLPNRGDSVKTDGKYRFSIQFAADSEEKQRVGEFLEKLGNKKSVIIVSALNQYLIDHQELCERTLPPVRIEVASYLTDQRLEQIVEKILTKRLVGNILKTSDGDEKLVPETMIIKNDMERDVEAMLNNLDVFDQN